MNLSTFDLASRLTGWCSGSGDALPVCGVWEFSAAPDDLGGLLRQFRIALDQHFLAFDPVLVAYEAPILVVNNEKRGTDKLAKIRRLYAMGAFLEYYCLERGVKCVEASPQAIKKALTGNFRADKTAMVAAAKRIGMTLPTGPGEEDAADAFGLFLLLLSTVSRDKMQRFDKALWGARGAFL